MRLGNRWFQMAAFVIAIRLLDLALAAVIPLLLILGFLVIVFTLIFRP